METVTLQIDGPNPELTGILLGVALGTIEAPAKWHHVKNGLPQSGDRVTVYTVDGRLLSAWLQGARWIFHARRQDYTVTHWRPWEG